MSIEIDTKHELCMGCGNTRKWKWKWLLGTAGRIERNFVSGLVIKSFIILVILKYMKNSKFLKSNFFSTTIEISFKLIFGRSDCEHNNS